MEFNYTRGIEKTDNYKINYRKAVRAVIIKDNKLLMIKTNKGDYKFPGGGVNNLEDNTEALKREVKEESGYVVTNIIKPIGKVIDRSIDKLDKDFIFEMESNYYLCEVNDIMFTQNLDKYEDELGFIPKWISVEEAIHANEICIKTDEKRNFWVERETEVLEKLKNIIFKK